MQVRSVTKIAIGVCLILMVTVVGAWANQAVQPTPKLVTEETVHSFDPVVDGAVVTHDFVVVNEGDAVLNISKVKTG